VLRASARPDDWKLAEQNLLDRGPAESAAVESAPIKPGCAAVESAPVAESGPVVESAPVAESGPSDSAPVAEVGAAPVIARPEQAEIPTPVDFTEARDGDTEGTGYNAAEVDAAAAAGEVAAAEVPDEMDAAGLRLCVSVVDVTAGAIPGQDKEGNGRPLTAQERVVWTDSLTLLFRDLGWSKIPGWAAVSAAATWTYGSRVLRAYRRYSAVKVVQAAAPKPVGAVETVRRVADDVQAQVAAIMAVD